MSGIGSVGGPNPHNLPLDPLNPSPASGATPAAGVGNTAAVAETPPVSGGPIGNVVAPSVTTPRVSSSPLDRPKIVIPVSLSNFSVADLAEMIQHEVRQMSDVFSSIKRVQIKESAEVEKEANKAQWQKLMLLADPVAAKKAQDAMQEILRIYQWEGASSALRRAEHLAPELTCLVAFMTLTQVSHQDQAVEQPLDAESLALNQKLGITPDAMIAMHVMSALFVAISTIGFDNVRDVFEEGGILANAVLLSASSGTAEKMNNAAIKHVQTLAQSRGGFVGAFDDIESTLVNGWQAIKNFGNASPFAKEIVADTVAGKRDLAEYQVDSFFHDYLDQMSSDSMLQAFIQSASDNADAVNNLLQTELLTKSHLATLPNNA